MIKMKRISNILFCSAFAILSALSCKVDVVETTENAPSAVILNQGSTELNDQGFGIYYTDKYRTNSGVFYLVLSDAACYRDGFDAPYLDSQGDMLVLELNTELLRRGETLDIPAGRYSLQETKSGESSIIPSASYVVRLDGHTQSRYEIRSGSIDVVRTPDGGYDIVTEDFVIAKDGVEQEVSYSFYGDIKFEDYNSVAPTMVTINDDIVDMPFPSLVALYYGNLYGYGTANYVLTLYTENFDESTTDSPGILLTINLFADLISGDELPELDEGKYTVKATFDATEYSILYGLTMTSSEGASYAFGSYVYQIDANLAGTIDYVTSGTMDVDLDEETGVYTLVYDFRTASSRTVKGTWTGKMTFSDLSTDDDRVVLSTLEDDVDCDLSKIETGTLAFVEQLQTTSMEPLPISDVWRLSLQPRDFNEEEKKLPWDERIEVYCPDGDAMIFEFVLGLGSDGNPAPIVGKEYEYRIQPDLAMTDYDYQLCVSKMGRPYDDIFDPAQSSSYYFVNGYDFCNSRRGFTWATDGYRGVWYFHYLEKHWLNLDEHAPAIRGSIIVKSLENPKTVNGHQVLTLKVDWDLIDDSDAANKIRGSWTGPVTIRK
jgi:hypothetical protein